jgi:hypothetical protein
MNLPLKSYFFKTIILSSFPKINKNLYKLIPIEKSRSTLHQWQCGGEAKIGEERTTLYLLLKLIILIDTIFLLNSHECKVNIY